MNQEQERLAHESIARAEAMEELVKTQGWKYLMEVVQSLMAKEVGALGGQPIEASYYRRIGFVQMLKFICEIPDLLKDKKVREFLLHQGRVKGCEMFAQLPQLFFDGRAVGRQVLNTLLEGKPLTQDDIRDFHEKTLRQG